MSKPNLLFVSPVFPDLSGNGLAMRAGSLIEALSQRHRLYLLVAPVHDSPARSLNPTIASWCADHAVIRPPRFPRLTSPALPKPPEWRSLPAGFLKRAAGVFSDIRFATIYVFRLYLAPVGLCILRDAQPGAVGVLDLDEVESDTRRSLAARYRDNGLHDRHRQMMQEAGHYEGLEDYYVPLFEQVVLCSDHEAELLRPRHPAARLTVIPNAVRIPARAGVGPPADAAERGDAGVRGDAGPPGDAPGLLFVGNPNYFPNRDGLEFLAVEILPHLNRIVAAPACVDVVGFDQPRSRVGDEVWTRFRYHGSVPSVGPYYDGARVVVVPLRAGGGTRIKILEAFSHRRPVVSTKKGAEGLAVESGRHLLLADRPQEFAEHCARLMRQPESAASMVDEAYGLVSRMYSQSVVDQIVSETIVA